MEKLPDIFVALGLTGSKQLLQLATEAEQSGQRFKLLGADEKDVDLLMHICNQHRRSFEFDKRLAQVVASGAAGKDDIAALAEYGPGSFKNFGLTYGHSRLGETTPWRELLGQMHSPK